MYTAVLYNEFSHCRVDWFEENVADMYTLDYLQLTRATDEEILTAEPCTSDNHPPVSNAFIATYVSLKLKTIVHNLCSSVLHRKFHVHLKHLGCRGKNVSGVHVEISSALLDSGQPFEFWLHYNIYSITDYNEMCTELAIWQKHLTKK